MYVFRGETKQGKRCTSPRRFSRKRPAVLNSLCAFKVENKYHLF